MVLSALLLGLLGSLHCLGMCGPIAFMLPLRDTRGVHRALLVSLYHFGRLFSYALLGVAFGLLGRGLNLFGIQQTLSVTIGLLMILLVLVPASKISGHRLMQPVHSMLGKVRSNLGPALSKQQPDALLTIGLLNGLLPCGLVYMALLGALAMGAPLAGGGYMLLFGLGTVPMMTAAVYSRAFFGERIRIRFQRLIPVFVVIIGLLFVLRGLGLGIPYLSPASPSSVEMVTNSMNCHQ